MHGWDALQALILALGFAQRELARAQQASGGALTWLDGPDLGLPDMFRSALAGLAPAFRAPSQARHVGSREAASQRRAAAGKA